MSLDEDDLTPVPGGRREPEEQAEESPAARGMVRREEDEQALDRAMASAYRATDLPDPDQQPAFLYVERGPGAGQLVPVRQGPLLIGRSSNAGMRLQHPSISRRHAQLSRRGEQFFIRDLASQNGTYVNHSRIGREIEIFPGDELVLGTAVLRLQGTANYPGYSGGEDPSPATLDAGGPSITGIALTAGAVGFGLAAVVMFAVFKFSQGPVYEDLTEPVQLPAQEAPPEPPRRTAPSSPASDPEPDSEPELEPDSEPEPEPEEPPAGATGATILAHYEDGELAAAIELAQKRHSVELVSKLTRFQVLYEAGQRAMASRDTAGAIKNFEAALALDEQLSGGWGKFNTELRRRLSSLRRERPSGAAPPARETRH